MEIVAHLYNTSIHDHNGVNQAVYTQKDRNPMVYTVGLLDIERNVLSDNFPYPWQTDTCVGGWFYDVRRIYKTAGTVIEMLVDIVAKNGNLLLNFTQKPDGSLDDECHAILDEMAEWNKVNAEGIYETRPWHIAMEGGVNASQERFREKALDWTSEDYRFTQKGKSVYAFQMRWPEDGKAVIKSFSAGSGGYRLKVADVANVELLGYEGKIEFEHTKQGLSITGLPENAPGKYAPCYKITTK